MSVRYKINMFRNIRYYIDKIKFQAALPERWGRCLLNTCYSLWFLHLPAMLQVSSQPANILHQAYELLVKMQKLRLDPMEEVRLQNILKLIM